MAPPPSWINLHFVKCQADQNVRRCRFLKANGDTCDAIVRLGNGTTRSGSSNLHSHAERHHSEKYLPLLDKHTREKATKGVRHLRFKSTNQIQAIANTLEYSSENIHTLPVYDTNWKKQQTLVSCLMKKKPWAVTDKEAQPHHYRLAEMCIASGRALNLCNDYGLGRLISSLESRYIMPSPEFLKENIIPVIKTKVKAKVSALLQKASNVSFTSDIWSAPHSQDSFISLTAHIIDESFEQDCVVLSVKPFDAGDNRHTGENITTMLNRAIDEFQIPEHKIHLLIKDNAANIVSGVNGTNYTHLSCFLHTLQLIIKHSIFEQDSVRNLISVCKSIVTHIIKSPAANSQMKDIQKTLGLPQHRPIQDIDIRWNSTLHMLARFNEQTQAIIQYCVQNINKVASLSTGKDCVLYMFIIYKTYFSL